jgi:hypothetical protein
MDKSEVLNIFHPAVKEWFLNNIGKPSPPQIEGWPQIQSGKNVLISAPTGAGKTLAAFLESINRLLEMGLKKELPEGVFILYVSPLKALNNDINKNLEIPFQGIRQLFTEKGEAFPDIRKAVRTGDTSQYERTQILKNPPHILITTPESLFLMLTSQKAREILKNVYYLRYMGMAVKKQLDIVIACFCFKFINSPINRITMPVCEQNTLSLNFNKFFSRNVADHKVAVSVHVFKFHRWIQFVQPVDVSEVISKVYHHIYITVFFQHFFSKRCIPMRVTHNQNFCHNSMSNSYVIKKIFCQVFPAA